MSNVQKTLKIILRRPANSSSGKQKKQISSCANSASGLDKSDRNSLILKNKENQVTSELKSQVRDHRAAASCTSSDKASRAVKEWSNPDRGFETLRILEWPTTGKRSRNIRRALVLNPGPKNAPVEDDELPLKKRKLRSSKIYLCNICNRSFKSHQALGGHKAWHSMRGHDMSRPDVREDNNYAIVVAREKSHKCETCDREFRNGQALGGHKRHCKHRAFAFDLNEYPPEWSF